MINKKQITYQGIRVDVVEARQDTNHDVQISVLGDPSFNKKPFKDYKDTELEAQGWKKLALVNGSLFFSEGTQTYANGIEKSMGAVHENDDAAWDNNLGFYHYDGVPFIYPQSYIKKIINQPNVRGAITSAFGLINNGVQDIRGARVGEPSRAIYLAKSGRTIIGKKVDGTIVFATCDGVTGSSGLTGYQTYLFAKGLGLQNAVCMDGGGSTYLEYKGATYNGSDRQGANAVAIYYKEKVATTGIQAGSKVSLGNLTVSEVNNNKALIKELGVWVDVSALVKI